MKQNLYETLIQKNAHRLSALQRKLSLLSFGRITSFLLFLGGMLFGYFTHPGFYFAGWASFAVFVALIWAHSRKKEISGFLLQLCESDPGADSGNPDDHFHAGDMFGGLG